MSNVPGQLARGSQFWWGRINHEFLRGTSSDQRGHCSYFSFSFMPSSAGLKAQCRHRSPGSRIFRLLLHMSACDDPCGPQKRPAPSAVQTGFSPDPREMDTRYTGEGLARRMHSGHEQRWSWGNRALLRYTPKCNINGNLKLSREN